MGRGISWPAYRLPERGVPLRALRAAGGLRVSQPLLNTTATERVSAQVPAPPGVDPNPGGVLRRLGVSGIGQRDAHTLSRRRSPGSADAGVPGGAIPGYPRLVAWQEPSQFERRLCGRGRVPDLVASRRLQRGLRAGRGDLPRPDAPRRRRCRTSSRTSGRGGPRRPGPDGLGELAESIAAPAARGGSSTGCRARRPPGEDAARARRTNSSMRRSTSTPAPPTASNHWPAATRVPVRLFLPQQAGWPAGARLAPPAGINITCPTCSTGAAGAHSPTLPVHGRGGRGCSPGAIWESVGAQVAAAADRPCGRTPREAMGAGMMRPCRCERTAELRAAHNGETARKCDLGLSRGALAPRPRQLPAGSTPAASRRRLEPRQPGDAPAHGRAGQPSDERDGSVAALLDGRTSLNTAAPEILKLSWEAERAAARAASGARRSA